MRTTLAAISMALVLAGVAVPVMAGHTTVMTESETLGNSGRPAGGDQGGNGTTTTTTTTSGPPGQMKNGNTGCNNCDTSTTVDGPGNK